MPAFLILHGLESHRPPQHWQFWLAARLAEQGHPVLYPGLPEPDAPLLDDWIAALQAQLAELAGADEVVVLCHSLSCLLWFHAAARLGDALQVDRLLLVAPPDPAVLPATAATFRIAAIDAAAVRASVRGDLRLAVSDVDEWCPPGGQALFGEALGITADVFPGMGHINPDSGLGPWPWVEAWALGEPASG